MGNLFKCILAPLPIDLKEEAALPASFESDSLHLALEGRLTLQSSNVNGNEGSDNGGSSYRASGPHSDCEEPRIGYDNMVWQNGQMESQSTFGSLKLGLNERADEQSSLQGADKCKLESAVRQKDKGYLKRFKLA
ncbi:unnamed protein product [Protopolystoma xenopodis]|uniref:Uncharacterized protein n=1 Tax=Protopolystoma xenopodis TaxID=117903 RepID=A0A3S5B2Y3_9PLAT|nr:unnamed protein product [Protopolystoma xenopodis]